MRYYIYEIAGWALLGLGLYVFVLCYEMLANGHFLSSAPLTVIGFIVFRGGLYLMKVGVAARVCTSANQSPPAARPTVSATASALRRPSATPVARRTL